MAEQHPDQEESSEEELAEALALADALESGSARGLSESGVEGAALLRVAASPRLDAAVQDQQRRELEARVGAAAERRRRDETRADAQWARWWLWLAPGLGAAALWVLFMRGPVQSRMEAAGSVPPAADGEGEEPSGELPLGSHQNSQGLGGSEDGVTGNEAEQAAADSQRVTALERASRQSSMAKSPASRSVAKASRMRSRSASGAGPDPLAGEFAKEQAARKGRRAQQGPKAVPPAVSEPVDLATAKRPPSGLSGGAVGEAPTPSRALLVAQLATLRGDRGARPRYTRHLRDYRQRLLASLEEP